MKEEIFVIDQNEVETKAEVEINQLRLDMSTEINQPEEDNQVILYY